MTALIDWPAVQSLSSADLVLEPLQVEDAEEMAPLLDDARLHTYIGGEPASQPRLRERYRHQVVGHSADGAQLWFNWVLRRKDTNRAVGYVQATVSTEDDAVVAEVAWVVASAHQGRGYARQGSAAMVKWLGEAGADRTIAHVHPDHPASVAVARAIGMRATKTVIDGEVRWVT